MPLRPASIAAIMTAACLLGGCQEGVPESVASNAIPDATPTEELPLLAALATTGDHPGPRAYLPMDDAGEGGICALDAINMAGVRKAALRAEGSALFSGWVGDAGSQVPAMPALVFKGAESSHAVEFAAGASRPDVAEAHASSALAASGFNVTVRMDGFAPGRYALFVVVDSVAGTYCDLHAVIEVRP